MAIDLVAIDLVRIDLVKGSSTIHQYQVTQVAQKQPLTQAVEKRYAKC